MRIFIYNFIRITFDIKYIKINHYEKLKWYTSFVIKIKINITSLQITLIVPLLLFPVLELRIGRMSEVSILASKRTNKLSVTQIIRSIIP